MQKDTIILFENKPRLTHLFQDSFLLASERDTIRFTQRTYYALGIGQIMYSRSYSDGRTQTFILEKILSEEEWNQLHEI